MPFWLIRDSPLMYETKGKWWLKYITILVLENSEVQGSRGLTWNKYISMSYTKSYLRMPWSIYCNTSSFTIIDYIIWYGYKTTYITKVDQSHNIQWWVFKIWKLCKVNITQSCTTLVIDVNLRSSSKSKGTGTIQAMWMDVLKSNMEIIQQIFNQ